MLKLSNIRIPVRIAVACLLPLLAFAGIAGKELLDKELATREFIAGPNYSVADITALVAYDFMKPSRIVMPDNLANVKRWHAAVSARPSAKA